METIKNYIGDAGGLTDPKLIGIGIMTPVEHMQAPAQRVYLIEDRNCFIGYARGMTKERMERLPDYPPVLNISTGIVGALRWCRAIFPPKGNENVDELCNEIYDIIINEPEDYYMSDYNEIIHRVHHDDTKYKKETYKVRISDPQNLVEDWEKEAFKYY